MAHPIQAQLLVNPDFERPFPDGWTPITQGGLVVGTSTNSSLNRNASARIVGTLPNGPSTNGFTQAILARAGDMVVLTGYVKTAGDTNNSATFEVALAGSFTQQYPVSAPINTLRTGWIPFSARARALDNTTLTLTVQVVGGTNDSGKHVDIYLDAFKLTGASGQPVDPGDAFRQIQSEAQALASGTGAMPAPDYPPLYNYGYPGNFRPVRYPAYVEAFFSGYPLMELTNSRPLRVTNRIAIARLDNQPAELALDAIAFVAKDAHRNKWSAPVINTNPPYFSIGTRDNSSAEFSTNQNFFAREFTFRVGQDSLTNFPARLSTESNGWPAVVNLVFDVPTTQWSVFTDFLWSRHTLLASICPDARSAANKAVTVSLQVDGAVFGLTNLQTHELHLGAASETEAFGMIDYPNTGYGGHNCIDLRQPWVNNILDNNDWYVATEARGNDIVEPVEIYFYRPEVNNWYNAVYEEYIYNTCNSMSGVRRIADTDYDYRMPGRASYHVGLKIGHKAGVKNRYGTFDYPILRSERGNGYSRYAAYQGAMGGSFRVLTCNPFSLYTNREDYPRLVKTYVQIVPPDAAAGIPAFCRTYSLYHSKSNSLLAAAAQCDFHADPAEAITNGIYSELNMQIYFKRALEIETDGPFGLLGQSSMHWRKSSPGELGLSAHDIDRVTIFNRRESEWATVRLGNPSNSVRHISLGALSPDSTIMLLQTDRRSASYQAYQPEIPYREASHYIIDMQSVAADVSGTNLPLNASVLIQKATGETDDNVVINPTIATNLPAGERLNIKYRYKIVKSPGVDLLLPPDSSAGFDPHGSIIPVRFTASMAEQPLRANLYYGSGADGAWIPIATNLTVPTNGDCQVNYEWDTAGLGSGSVYLKATAELVGAQGIPGMDISSARLELGGYSFTNAAPNLWTPAAPSLTFDATGKTVLSLYVQGSGTLAGSLLVTDASLNQASYPLAFPDRPLYPQVQRVDIPWSALASIQRDRVQTLQIVAPPPGLQVVSVRARNVPLLVATRIVSPPVLNAQQMPHYNASDTLTTVSAITNLTAAPLAVSLRLLHEYATDSTWVETTREDPPHPRTTTNFNHHVGDRLEGQAETRQEVTIPALGYVLVTNHYVLPVGLPKGSAYVFRNDPGIGRLHITARVGGQVMVDESSITLFSIDDDQDQDNDLMEDAWEQRYFGSRTAALPDADPDADGLSNLEEFLGGRNPLLAEPRFALAIQSSSNHSVIVSHDAIPGRYYLLRAADTLTNSYASIATNLATGPELRITNGTAEPPMINYRSVEFKTAPAAFVNGDFESGTLASFQLATSLPGTRLVTDTVHGGGFALAFEGAWTNWACHTASQEVFLFAGDTVRATGYVYVAAFASAATNCLAGIKIERSGNALLAKEAVVTPASAKNVWTPLVFDFTASETGHYRFGPVVAGGAANAATSVNIFFDDLIISAKK